MTENTAASAASLPNSPATPAAAFFAQPQPQPGTAFFFPAPAAAATFYPGGPSGFLHPSAQPAGSTTAANVAVPPSGGGSPAGGVLLSSTCPPFVPGVCAPQLFASSTATPAGNVVVGSGAALMKVQDVTAVGGVPSAFSSPEDVPSLLGAGGMHQPPLLPVPGKRTFPVSSRVAGEGQQPADFGSSVGNREWRKSPHEERRDNADPAGRERTRDDRNGAFPMRDPRRDNGGGPRRSRASEEEDCGWGGPGAGRRKGDAGREDERWRRPVGSSKTVLPLGDATHLGMDDRPRGGSPNRGEDVSQNSAASLHSPRQPPLLSSPPGWDTNTPSHDNHRRHLDLPGVSCGAPAPPSWADLASEARGNSRRSDIPSSRHSRLPPRSSSVSGGDGGDGETPGGLQTSRAPPARRKSPARLSPRSRRGESPRRQDENRRSATHGRGGGGPSKAAGGRRGGRGASLPYKRRRGQRQSDDSRGSPSLPRRRGSPSIQRPPETEHQRSRSSSIASWPPVRSNSSVSMDRGSDDSFPRDSGEKTSPADGPDVFGGAGGGPTSLEVLAGGEEGNKGAVSTAASAGRPLAREPDGSGGPADWKRPGSSRGGERGKGDGGGEKNVEDKDEKKKGEAFDLWVPTTFHPSFTQRVRLVLGPKGRTHKEMEQLAKMRVQIYGNEMVRCTTKHGYDSFRDNQPLHLLVSFDRARRHGATADTPRRAREVLESFLEQLVERTWPRDEQRPVQTFYDKQVAMGPSHGPLVYVHPLGLYEEPPPKELEDCLVYRPTGIVRGPGRKGGEFTRRAEEDVEEDEAGHPYEGDPTMLLNCTPPLCLLLLTLQALHALLWEDGAQEIRQLPAIFEEKWDVCLLHKREDFQAACVNPERQAKGLGPATDKPAADDGYGGLLSFVQEFPEVFEILPERASEGKAGAKPRFDRVKVRAKESPNFAHVAHRFKTTNPWLERGN